MKSAEIRDFFWYVFFWIRTEYRDLLRKSPYSVQIQENTDQEKVFYLDTFHAVQFSGFYNRYWVLAANFDVFLRLNVVCLTTKLQ